MVSWAFLVMTVNTAVHHEMNQVNSLFFSLTWGCDSDELHYQSGWWLQWHSQPVLTSCGDTSKCTGAIWVISPPDRKKIVVGSLMYFLAWFFFSTAILFLLLLFVCFLIFSVLKLDSLCLHGMTQIYPASKSRWRRKDLKTGEHTRHKSYIFYRCEIYSGLSYFKNVHVLLFNKCNQKEKWWFSLAAIKVCTVVVTLTEWGCFWPFFREYEIIFTRGQWLGEAIY